MKSTIIFKSSKGNLYLYDFQKKEIKPCHHIIYLCSILDNNDNCETLIKRVKDKCLGESADKEIEYYCRKYVLYRNMGYFSSLIKEEFVKYKTKDLVESIGNVNNIVFEVTDACNLNCKYCAYGSLYNDYDKRTNKKISFETIQGIFEYLLPFGESHTNKSAKQIVSIGFYGGEPLMNFDCIRRVVEYCKGLNVQTRLFQFTMTTNATLIDKYLDFLVENKFQITISLDGDEWGNSYRVFHNGEETFNKVFYNVKKIQETYPEYFTQYVSFNSVLHNRNSVEKTHSFIYEQFGKTPEIHSINSSGIKVEKKEEFRKMFVAYNDLPASKEIVKTRFSSDANTFALCQFLLWYGNDQYYDYESFLYSDNSKCNALTGTCFPFSRKIYITVNDKILPCEKISACYSLGKVENGKVYLDFESIIKRYNDYYSRMYSHCKDCYMINGCNQCIFQLNLEDEVPKCHGFCSLGGMQNYLRRQIDILENGDVEMKKLLSGVFLS